MNGNHVLSVDPETFDEEEPSVGIDRKGKVVRSPRAISKDAARWATHPALGFQGVLQNRLEEEPHGIDLADVTDILKATFCDLEQARSSWGREA